MKAIIVKQPFANLILWGAKPLETRTWQIQHRGDLLIVAGKTLHDGHCYVPLQLPGIIEDVDCVDIYKEWWKNEVPLHLGKAVCVATVTGCRPMEKRDEYNACCRQYPGAFVWRLENIRPVLPFEVRGYQGLFEVDDELILYPEIDLLTF